ncbi:MAG: hypothetical protein IR153_02385 [Flavobacterium sp.]|nr:hypothetical protein [Flavobacterium sp.]
MNDDIIYGFALAIAAALLGSYLFIILFTEYTFLAGIQILNTHGQLGKLIALGAILDLAVFLGLLYYKKDQMARGVLFGTIVLGILTFFV